jgi:hypothetical protein
MIIALDYGPAKWRRAILKKEYQGDALEKRLKMKIGGGWSMFLALWHMSRINMRPALSVGEAVPMQGVPLVPVSDADPDAASAAVELWSLSNSSLTRGIPMLLNFGSCS